MAKYAHCASERMSPRKADQKELRLTVTQEVYSLLKKLAGVKETSMNKLLNLAIDRLLEDEDIQELIRHYNLEE
jgi:predicted HicB family RNase H-like nuclease